MNMTTIVAAAALASILAGEAMADECSDAKGTLRVFSQNSDRTTKRAQAKIDSIPCCSAAYWQASCEYQKLVVEQFKQEAALARNVSLACDKRDVSDTSRKQAEEFTAQVEEKQQSDCKSAEDSRSREAREKRK